jgi:phosphoesterase RecJ-like protein
MPLDWSKFVEIVRRGRKFLLTSHVRPDCDALGSELGLAGALRAIGKEATIVNADETPPHIAFIDPRNEIRVLGRDIHPDELADFDVLIIVDTSAWKQLGTMADVVRSTAARVVVIDHHVSEDDMGGDVFKDSQSESTGSLIVAAAEALAAPLTPLVARALFAAIATDTGWFRFASVSGATFAVVAKLVEAGAVPQQVFAELYERHALPRLRLRGRIMDRVQSRLEGRLLYTTVRNRDFEETGSLPGDTEDSINYLFTVAGTEVAVLFVEQPADEVKVSLRSRGAVDVRKVAEAFGGGGHTAAAGVMVAGSLDEVTERVLDALSRAMA